VLLKITCEINPHPNTTQSTIAFHTTLAFTYC
jgi:predicted GNAT superfamily acetyltransferase